MAQYLKFFLDAIQFLHNSMHLLWHIENIYHPNFLDLLLFFSFFVQPGESIFESTRLTFTL